MSYKNDLAPELESKAHTDPAAAVPELLNLVHRLLAERHAYRLVLEPIAYTRFDSIAKVQSRAHEVCEEFVRSFVSANEAGSDWWQREQKKFNAPESPEPSV